MDQKITSESWPSLLCPNCKGSLQKPSLPQAMMVEMICNACGLSFPLDDDIVDLRVSRKDYYFNPVPQPEMQELTASMWEVGWPQTIQRFLRSVNNRKDWLDNLVADGRYAWKLFLPLTPETVLLDLGCGLGNLTANLAPHVAKVYAMDLTYDRLKFAKQRIQNLAIREKVKFLAGGDGPFLPFPDHSLDCVVLSGVLEWVGEGGFSWEPATKKLVKALKMTTSPFGDSSPRNIQRNFLREIARVLRPDGFVFVGIENRLSYEYFIGRPDHHSGLLGGSLLPRVVANLYSIMKNYRPYRTYTYSFNGYKKLLRQENFFHVKALGLSPGYSNLEKIIPLDSQWDFWKPTTPTFKERVQDHKHFVPAFGILGSGKLSTSSELFSSIARQIQNELCVKLGQGEISLSKFFLSNKGKGIAYGVFQSVQLVIKFPFSAHDEKGEGRHWEFLSLSQQKHWNDLLKCPQPLVCGTINNQQFFVEERIQGSLLFHHDWASIRHWYHPVRMFLLEWEQQLSMQERALTKDWFNRQVTIPLEQLELFFQVEGLFPNIHSYFEKYLMGTNLVCGLRHGDLSASNLFVKNKEFSGLMDWEQYDVEGIHFFNALDFLYSANRLEHRSGSLESLLKKFLRKEFACSEEQTFYEDWCQQWNLSLEEQEALLFLHWIQYVQGLLSYGLQYDEARLSKVILPMLHELAAR